ncbi:imelysin family protein [Echinicola sediminis]
MNYKSLSLFVMILVTGTMCLLPSCVNDPEEKTEEVDRTPLLEDLADNVILPGYTWFHTSAYALQEGIAIFVETPNEENLELARERFVQAYHQWQSVAFFDFGPAFTHTLRANVNTFPTDNFSIDNAIDQGSIDLDKISAQNKKGFPAIDYLLFGTGETTAEVVAQYTSDEKAENRKAYLKAVADDIFLKTDQVYNGWLPAEGDYRATFISKNGTDVGSSLGQIVNSLSQYFESVTRDAKIGIPLGKRSQGVAIPRQVEAFYSGNSISLASENLKAIKNFYLGNFAQNSGDGLYDYLKSINAQYNGQLLADAILAQLEVAENKTSNIPSPFSESVESNPEKAEEAHMELQKMVILIKVDMSSALGVLISYQDNDGD